MKISEILQENKEDLTQLVAVKFGTSVASLTNYFQQSISFYSNNKNEQTKVKLIFVLRKIQHEIESILFDKMWQDNVTDIEVEITFNEFVLLNNDIEDYIETL